MTPSKAKALASLFRTAAKRATKYSSSSSLPAGDKALKQFASSLDTSPPPPSSTKRSPKPTKKPASDGILHSWLQPPASENSTGKLTKDLSSILRSGARGSSCHFEEMMNDGSSFGREFDIPWISCERKQKGVYKKTQVGRLYRLTKMCVDKLGIKATMEVFDKLGRDTGLKDYNALIEVCVEKARTSKDEDDALEHMYEAFRTFNIMRERGFKVEEGTYSPLLMYFIDTAMVEEFFFFCGLIKEGNPNSVARLGYYEMLLWTRVNNEEKIREICNSISAGDEEDDFELKENYLLALRESGREDLIRLLEGIDNI
ncbi:hypothetical protein HRI_004697700 [Hibiscus trionum]|uniref:Pentatricopeptide repeat-containing protein n=1 Tax=Hibiscus trionum TaxID=183268 RepID=A0A9W7MSZ7_HIBTR|nr:hypothetical protein HRI_004697700 [Hibiscus trionum]